MKGFIKTFRAPIAYLAVSLFFLGYANYEFYEGSQASFWLLSGVSALFMVNAFATVLHISRLLKQEEARQAALEATRLREAEQRLDAFNAAYAAGGFVAPMVSESKTLARNKLLESMNDTQRHTFLTMSYFDVTSDKGHLWRIRTTSITGNVELLAPRSQNGKHSYCIHLKDVSCPAEDHWLAQALLLKISEKDFLSTAF